MLARNRRAILERLADGDRVLDVGGWALPFSRADWVLDLLPYATRGRYGYSDAERASERFTEQTWVQADACGSEPWPWPDDYFDFAICSQMLEDLRDPLRVCSELGRVAKAGYIEVPSRLEEQTRWLNGAWAGWNHHRWICEVRDDQIDFVPKGSLLDVRRDLCVPHRVWARAGAEARVQALWWTDRPVTRELSFIEKSDHAAWLRRGVPVRGDTLPSRLVNTAHSVAWFATRGLDRVLRQGLSAHRKGGSRIEC